MPQQETIAITEFTFGAPVTKNDVDAALAAAKPTLAPLSTVGNAMLNIAKANEEPHRLPHALESYGSAIANLGMLFDGSWGTHYEAAIDVLTLPSSLWKLPEYRVVINSIRTVAGIGDNRRDTQLRDDPRDTTDSNGLRISIGDAGLVGEQHKMHHHVTPWHQEPHKHFLAVEEPFAPEATDDYRRIILTNLPQDKRKLHRTVLDTANRFSPHEIALARQVLHEDIGALPAEIDTILKIHDRRTIRNIYDLEAALIEIRADEPTPAERLGALMNTGWQATGGRALAGLRRTSPQQPDHPPAS